MTSRHTKKTRGWVEERKISRQEAEKVAVTTWSITSCRLALKDRPGCVG